MRSSSCCSISRRVLLAALATLPILFSPLLLRPHACPDALNNRRAALME